MATTADRAPGALLTVPQAAAALAIGRRKTWELIACGALQSVRIGRAVRVDPADLKAFIRDCKRRRGGP